MYTFFISLFSVTNFLSSPLNTFRAQLLFSVHRFCSFQCAHTHVTTNAEAPVTKHRPGLSGGRHPAGRTSKARAETPQRRCMGSARAVSPGQQAPHCRQQGTGRETGVGFEGASAGVRHRQKMAKFPTYEHF